MKLTPYQKRYLEALATFRKQKPTVWSVLMFRPLSWVPFALIAAASVGLYLVVDERWGMFMIGMTTGAVLRIVAYARFTLMAWAVVEQITDWPKVDELREQTA